LNGDDKRGIWARHTNVAHDGNQHVLFGVEWSVIECESAAEDVELLSRQNLGHELAQRVYVKSG
jgi:hypothetical protein